jgi:ATP-binding cassette, subfamily B, bacterial
LARSLDILASKLRGISAELPYVPRAIALVWEAAPGWTALWGALLVAQGILPVATVYLTKAVVDALVAATRAGGDWSSLRAAMAVVLAMGAVLALGEALKAAAGHARTAQSELVGDSIHGLIHRKSIEADLAFYDSPEYFNHLHRAREESAYRPLQLLENLGGLAQNSITLVAMGAVVARFGWWIPVALVVGTLPAFVVVVRYSVEQHSWRRRVTGDERRSWYYEWLLTSSEAAAELRLYGLGSHFQGLYQSLRGRLRAERLAMSRRNGWAEAGAGLAALAVAALALLWMGWRAARGGATLGELALFYQAFQQGLGLARTLLTGVGQLYYNLLFLGNLFEFLALTPKVVRPAEAVAPPETPVMGIRFRGVRFRYPGSRETALDGFSLDIPAGRVAAVVGPNGAGKSTLLKLLCRFYDPEQGAVELDGVDLRKLDLDELRRRIAVLFQQPVHYHETVAGNIALGDWTSVPDDERIEQAARDAGAGRIVEKLPQGFETPLGRMFADGMELSVGEWQRVALARAFYRRAGILVLDEPTSAMDPWAEADWLSRFRRLAQGRTALVITHRFTTAMYADVIHVMADGRVVESGTHEELLALGGQYAVGWRAQQRDR